MLGLEALRQAGQSLWNRKMRSLLTILGVVIGIGSVITVVSLGAAFERSITSQFDEVDDRSIFVEVGQAGPQQGPPDGGQTSFVFTEVDRQNVAAIAGVERVIASGDVSLSSIEVGGQQKPWDTLRATHSAADEVRDHGAYLLGGPFGDGEAEVVLGYGAAKYLSGASAAQQPSVNVGDALRLHLTDGSHIDATVAGVLAEQTSLFGSNNNQIFGPLDPFYARTIRSPSTGATVAVYDGFTVIATEDADIDAVRDAVAAYMRDSSDAIAFLDDAAGYGIFVATASDIQGVIGQAFDQVTLFIAAIAATSLLVGGIMIGTIMLITVTERTKEIGVMKAIGGLDRDILWMFLLEAAIIGLVGSLVGIGIGLAGGLALVEGLFGAEDVSFVVPWQWIGISLGVGVATGMVAGFLPARRATKIEPVEALSYE